VSRKVRKEVRPDPWRPVQVLDAVGVIAVESGAVVTLRGDVAGGTGEFEAKRAGHGAKSCGLRRKG
jgi:hypothetical protein